MATLSVDEVSRVARGSNVCRSLGERYLRDPARPHVGAEGHEPPVPTAAQGSLKQEPAQGSGLTYGVVVVVAALAGGHFWMHALKLL